MRRLRFIGLLVPASTALVGLGLALSAVFIGRPTAAGVAAVAALVGIFLCLERRGPLRAQVLDEFESQFMD